jgi:hypothetical protein
VDRLRSLSAGTNGEVGVEERSGSAGSAASVLQAVAVDVLAV